MRGVASLLLWAGLPALAPAAGLVVEVRDAHGGALAEAVVYAVPEGRKAPPPSRPAVLDQKNRTFVPHVLAVQTGTAVTFPNSDNVRHQVYSFSPAKRFQLPSTGTPAAPVVFDKPGVVAWAATSTTHERLRGGVDTPHFA